MSPAEHPTPIAPSTGFRFQAVVASGAIVAAAVMVIAGFAGRVFYGPKDVAALCTGFESSWNDLMVARSATPSADDIPEAVESAIAQWLELSDQPGPKDVRTLLPQAAEHLTALQAAPDPQRRTAMATSLGNAATYIELACGRTDASITLSPMRSLVRPTEGE